jgi:hypothetical protein
MPQFVHDVEEIRQRAIQKIEDGPIMQSRHPARKAPDMDEVAQEPGEVRPGEEAGRSRSVHVTNPNRKRKRAA